MQYKEVIFEWVESQDIPPLPVRQVYAYCFDTGGNILLIKDGDAFNLPGGKPEAGESFEETLRREVLEEAQTLLAEMQLLGYQIVRNDMHYFRGRPYAQLRMAARIKEMLPSASDPATGRCYERLLYPPECVPDVLRWGASGLAQLKAACVWARSH